jgi:hypothetical protein
MPGTKHSAELRGQGGSPGAGAFGRLSVGEGGDRRGGAAAGDRPFGDAAQVACARPRSMAALREPLPGPSS